MLDIEPLQFLKAAANDVDQAGTLLSSVLFDAIHIFKSA